MSITSLWWGQLAIQNHAKCVERCTEVCMEGCGERCTEGYMRVCKVVQRVNRGIHGSMEGCVVGHRGVCRSWYQGHRGDMEWVQRGMVGNS